MTPETDVFPPVLHSNDWDPPVPMEGPINTAGAEDSPFITPDGSRFFLFFTPDVRIPAEKQIIDGVSGLWWSHRSGNSWTEPERILLSNDLALDGAAFVDGDFMWFASVRNGNYREVDLYTARLVKGKWRHAQNAGAQINRDYRVGEMHITADGENLYCGRAGSSTDLWVLRRSGREWEPPQRLQTVNTNQYNEDQPFISSDGNELWFTSESRLGHPGPAVFRSLRTEAGWGTPEEIVSSFAGEPTLDEAGNLYFVHHFFTADMAMIEADIYIARKR